MNIKKWNDRLALMIALVTIFAAYYVSDHIYERMAHFEETRKLDLELMRKSSGRQPKV